MAEQRLKGKRVLLTQADDYMGPATIEVFTEHGAHIVADNSDLTAPGAVEALVERAGHIDIVVANLAAPANVGPTAEEIDDNTFENMFNVMVYPLHRLCRAVLPQMYQRGSGKVVVYGSATGVKARTKIAAYAAARTAQVGYVRAVGLEAAPHNVQINLIAQNFVENPVYYPPEMVGTELFDRILKQVPAGRLATGREDALFALFLASQESDFFVGQAIPFSGGWAQ
ncbi:MAG: 2-keto-3-deoxy-L-fuconate dehydrogenase [Bacteroidia bacterium]|jgi:2-keto-3-deoxy-L-fuconate dehydrogenase